MRDVEEGTRLGPEEDGGGGATLGALLRGFARELEELATAGRRVDPKEGATILDGSWRVLIGRWMVMYGSSKE